MNKLFGLFLLALAFLAPGSAFAAQCFWVGGTATWDTTNTGGGGTGGIKWASTSGGASACAGGGTGGSPTAADSAVFDGSSGGGTVTVNFGGTITLLLIDFGSFTGTLDFATNNNSITLTANGNAVFNTGSGTRTINMGSGTWTLSGANGTWNGSTTTGLTLNQGTSTIAFTGTGNRIFLTGSKTYNNVTVGAAGSSGSFRFNGAPTFASLAITAPNTVIGPNGTVTITTLSVSGGSSSNQILFAPADLSNTTPFTVSSANNFTCNWCGLYEMTFSGGGTFTATNSFDFKNNTGITITGPSGGGGGGRIIGG